jgi:glycosyltransferase involved in cell wall biosynthesis
VVEQVERLARVYGYEVHLYCQRVEDIGGLEEFGESRGSPRQADCGEGPAEGPAPVSSRILWHKIADVPGPHLVKYLWWLLANQFRRRRDLRSHGLRYDLVYSPGINCWDADAIVVHIVFHEFYRVIRDELQLRKVPLRAWPRTLHRQLYYRLIMALEKRIYSNPRVTLAAVSRLTAQELRRFFGREDVHVIPNAVDVKAFNPAARQKRRAEARHGLRFEEDDFVLLLIGNDWKKKGLPCLLAAMGRLQNPNLRLLVVGCDNRAPYQAAIRQNGLVEQVSLLPLRPDVEFYYAAADAYVGPSLEDAFALPPAEAMACGLPVIVSRQAGVSEIIHDGVDGLILEEPTDAEGLARLIRQLCNDAELRRRLAANAIQTAQQYTWAHNAEQTKELFEQVVAQKQRDLAQEGEQTR